MPRRPLTFDPFEESRRLWSERWGDPGPKVVAVPLARAAQIIIDEMNAALRPFGLTWARYEALVLLLFSHKALPLNKIGERLMVHPTSITNTIDRLEEDGLVRREPHPTDGRATLAVLTPKGERLLNQARQNAEGRASVLDALTEHDVSQLLKIIRKIRISAGDIER